MRYERILQAISERPWCITRAKLEAICGIVAARADGIMATKEDIQAAVGAARQDTRPAAGSAVAVIPMYGTISSRPSIFQEFSGGASVTSLQRAFRQAMNDPQVGAIVFDVDSPGGTVDMVPELHAEILAARGQKPMAAVANTMAASAAFWLASAVDELAVTPSGVIGSVGCYMVHFDLSKAYEEAGIKATFIAYGEHKTEGNSMEPLSDDSRAYFQSQVDAIGRQFEEAVAAARGVSVKKVRDSWGQGRILMAEDAVKVGMVDRVMTLEDMIAKMAKKAARTGGPRAEASPNQPHADQDLLDRALTQVEMDLAVGQLQAELK